MRWWEVIEPLWTGNVQFSLAIVILSVAKPKSRIDENLGFP